MNSTPDLMAVQTALGRLLSTFESHSSVAMRCCNSMLMPMTGLCSTLILPHGLRMLSFGKAHCADAAEMQYSRSSLVRHCMKLMSISVRHCTQTDRKVADHVQYVAAAHSIPCYHGNHRLRQPSYLDLHTFQATTYNNTLSDYCCQFMQEG